MKHLRLGDSVLTEIHKRFKENKVNTVDFLNFYKSFTLRVSFNMRK